MLMCMSLYHTEGLKLACSVTLDICKNVVSFQKGSSFAYFLLQHTLYWTKYALI